MDHVEANAFEADPAFEDILGLRIYDERAKRENYSVPALDSYRPMLVRHLRETLEQNKDA
jgi:predicted HD phosphohydrolase